MDKDLAVHEYMNVWVRVVTCACVRCPLCRLKYSIRTAECLMRISDLFIQEAPFSFSFFLSW